MWKLDLFLHGRGNERLLDSYGDERLPSSSDGGSGEAYVPGRAAAASWASM